MLKVVLLSSLFCTPAFASVSAGVDALFLILGDFCSGCDGDLDLPTGDPVTFMAVQTTSTLSSVAPGLERYQRMFEIGILDHLQQRQTRAPTI